jgi:hypothetical protein
MRVSRRIFSVTAVAAAVAGLVLGGSVPALAADTPQAYKVLTVANDLPCGALLESAQTAASGPAFVSVYIENQHAGLPCVGVLERAPKGKPFAVISPKISVPSSKAVFTWAKSADYADGPGFRARVCVRRGTGPIVCSNAITLLKSTAKDSGAAEPVGYMQRQVHNLNSPAFSCSGTLSSTAPAKTATSKVDAFISDFASTKPCSGVVQESADGGHHWHNVSATHHDPASGNANAFTMGFTTRFADGKGTLARVCITFLTKTFCSAGW